MQWSATSVDKSGTEPGAAPAPRAPSVNPLQARVDAAAFALLREGRNPTVALVRARMGGGSPNVVAPALQRWRLTFAGQLDENAGSALEVLPPGVLELVQALWSRALFEAHRVRADARSSADALEQLNEAINALHDRTARLEKREVALDAELRNLERQRRRPVARAKAATRPTGLGRRVKPPPSAPHAMKQPSKPKRSKPTALPPSKRGGPTTRATARPPARRATQQR